MSRGAYKQYEFDPGICIPKSTMYNKRKRQIETEQEEGIEVENIPHGHGPDHEDLQNEDHLVSVESETNMFANEGNVESDTDGNHEVFDHCMRDENINAMEQEINSDEDIQDTNQPIYPGANVTKDQSLLLILCFMLRHKLTEVALKDLLVLLNTFFPDTMPSTKHRFYKSIKMENSEIHFYCPLCKSYLGKDTTQRSCESCGSLFSEAESMKNGHYFIYIPVQQQIEAMLFNDKLYEHLTNRDLELVKNSDTVNDITTSSLYKELIARYGFTGNDISLTWNTDGIPVFNSSKYSIWPLQASLNELPPHLRAKNILLVGLWFGDKPNMNTFLKPFVKECSVLQEDGFLFSHELNPRKVFPLLFCGDAPARAMVRNSKQFNGCYGCDWCESPGVTVPTNGPPARYYPHRTPVVQRTAQKQAEYALQATPKEPIKGVKGITVVDLLPTFETVRGVVTDYMHSVCQGVTRHMVNLWVDTKHHNEVYYIGRKVPLVDQRLQQISPPSEIHRAPRSLSERRYWKASEWRAFLFYSLVILQGILPSKYLNHFFLYVYGVYTLLGDSITSECIALSEACLTKFVIELEELYGLSQCTFNVHCLTHLASCVNDCGPLWATSAFPFESHNHLLLNMFNGTQYVPKQITDTFLMKNKVASLTNSCIDDNSSQSVRDTLHKLTDTARFEHGTCKGLTTLGCERFVTIDVHRVLAVKNLLNVNVINRSGVLHERFIYSHKLYSSLSYTRSKRHSNYSVAFEHSEYLYGIILGLLTIKPTCQCDPHTLQYCKCSQYKVVIMKPMVVTGRTLFRDPDFKVTSKFIVEVQDTNNIISIFPSQIKRKCISVTLGDKMYFCPLPYRIYGD